MSIIEFGQPRLTRFLFSDTRFAWFWFVVRVYIGYEWFLAGIDKITNPVWVGGSSGTAVKGFLQGALAKTSGTHPDVSGWYAYFIEHFAMQHTVFFSYLVAYGEVLVGIALILGLFTGISAFFGTFMNLNYLFAGTVSVNPIMLLLQMFLILAWKTAGYYGLDKYVLPILGTPWERGKLFR